jgi:hypothetical protein
VLHSMLFDDASWAAFDYLVSLQYGVGCAWDDTLVFFCWSLLLASHRIGSEPDIVGRVFALYEEEKSLGSS